MKKLVLAGLVAASVLVGNLSAKSEVYNIDSCQFTIDNFYLFKMSLLLDDIDRNGFLLAICSLEPNQKSKIRAVDQTFKTPYYKNMIVDTGSCSYRSYIDEAGPNTDYFEKCKVSNKKGGWQVIGKTNRGNNIEHHIMCSNGNQGLVSYYFKDTYLQYVAPSGHFSSLDEAANSICNR